MIAGWKNNGDLVMVEQMPMFGGYCGGAEETAICDVASTLASFAMLGANIHLDGPIHINWGVTTARETLQVAAFAATAVDMHTDLLLGNQYYTMAGPCTEMCLLETAAQAMTDTISGRELISGVASAKGVSKDKTTGMEARMMGETAIAVAGMSPAEVNSILDRLVSLYEPHFSSPPTGKRFQECYNLTTVEPSREYIRIYDKALQTLNQCGLSI